MMFLIIYLLVQISFFGTVLGHFSLRSFNFFVVSQPWWPIFLLSPTNIKKLLSALLSYKCLIRCLKHLPVFTLEGVNSNHLSSRKDKNTVTSKTLERGRKFKNEGYLSPYSIFTKCTKNTFTIKVKCSASMKKMKRDVVTLTRKTSRVGKAKCNCLAGASSYCNHIMALLFEIADYSL